MANYQYFSGANVIIRVGAQPILEVAGISYQETDTQMPIYGYGSRYFDAVAPGQKIIKGSFVINFVRPDYLAYAIQRGRELQDQGVVSSLGTNNDNIKKRLKQDYDYDLENKANQNTAAYVNKHDQISNHPDYQEALNTVVQSVGGSENYEQLSDEQKNQLITNEMLRNITASNYRQTQSNMKLLSNQLKDNMPSKYQENVYGLDVTQELKQKAVKDVTLNTAFNIDIVFSDTYVIKLLDCYISSRGAMIQIDESTIVEEYSFFARNLKTIRLDV